MYNTYVKSILLMFHKMYDIDFFVTKNIILIFSTTPAVLLSG